MASMARPLLARVALAAILVVLTRMPAIAAVAPPLVVYNAQHESLTRAWADAFTRETGIPVVLRNGGDSDLANQIVQEGSGSPADVFLTENSPAMTLVENAGLFASVEPATQAQVPARYRPSSGKWLGVAARSTVFVYNRSALRDEDVPKSLVDLASPQWKGRWAASPAGADFQAIVSAMLEIKGEAATAQWLAGMKANAASYRGNGAVLRAVNAGQVASGVIYHYYAFVDQAKTGENTRNVSVHYFRGKDPGAFVSVSGGGVLASSKQPAHAQAFLKWITSPSGQEILRTGSSFEYAVANGAASNPKLVPLGELDPPAIDPSRLNGRKVIELMTSAGLL